MKGLFIRFVAGVTFGLVAAGTVHATPEYERQWGLSMIRAAEAYDRIAAAKLPNGGDGVVVAISDSGVDFSHPDLAGKDAGSLHSKITDNHGTAIAGILAASVDDGGIMGVAWNAKLMAIHESEMDQHPEAARLGAGVISMSWCSDDLDAGELASGRALFQKAARAGAVLVASLGQDEEAGHAWPVGYAGDVDGAMIVVGSVDNDKNAISFPCGSRPQAQPKYCLFAPGHGVVGAAMTAPHKDTAAAYSIDDRKYVTESGASFAVPFVSGAAAVVRAINPKLKPNEVVRILLTTATPHHATGEDPSQLSPTYGHGILNLDAAVEAAIQTLKPRATSPD